jgi:hypothetical protein
VGSGFREDDAERGRNVVVNRSFVKDVLGGRNPVGRRFRIAGATRTDNPEPWYEIVGVVDDLGMNWLAQGSGAGFYQPRTDVSAGLHVIVHAKGDAESFAPRLRSVANSVDPRLQLHEVQRMDQLHAGVLKMFDIYLRLALGLSGVALILALAGIYSVMSFTVARRTREIGIRAALGAGARRVVLEILARPLRQVAAGVVAGAWLVALLLRAADGALSLWEAGLVIAYAAVMLAVCLIACVVPTWRALRVHPAHAVREDG